MKVAVQELSPVARALTIEVPEETVSREFSQAYEALRHRVRLPGFRPGKAPLALLEQRYAHEVEQDVLRRLIPEFYRRAVEEAGIVPVDAPAIDQVAFKRQAPLSFTARVEIRPAIVLQPYAGLRLSRRPAAVTEPEVESALQALQARHARLEACAGDHAAQAKDFVLMDFDGTVRGQPIPGASQQGYLAELGSGALIPGFEEQLVGHRAGEMCEVRVTFPADHPKAELAGQEGVFRVTVREIKRLVLPPVDDDLAKATGLADTLADLRQKVREELTAQRGREADQAVRDAAVDLLVQRHTFEVPPSLLERQLETLIRRAPTGPGGSGGPGAVPPSSEQSQQADQRGQSDQIRALRTQYEPLARRRVQAALLLEAIADQARIEVSEAEVEAEAGRMARELRLSPADARRLLLDREETQEGLRAVLRRQKALDLVMSQAVIDGEGG